MISRTAKADFLVAIYIFCLCAAEMMGAKTFPLTSIGTFQLNASVGIFLFPFIFSINDIFVEAFGTKRAKGIVRSGLVVILLIFGFSLFSTSLPPSSRFAANEAAYDTIFGLSARISAASLIAFGIADFLDVVIFSRLRKHLKSAHLWLRNNLSNFISQFIDTSLFMTLAFYNLSNPASDNIGFLWSLILPYWLLKCSASIIITPIVYAGVAWLKKE